MVSDAIIKEANWAMKDDPKCVAAHRRRLLARNELRLCGRDEIPAARAAFEAAKAEWSQIVLETFRRYIKKYDQTIAETV